jgi:hypothetical protein
MFRVTVPVVEVKRPYLSPSTISLAPEPTEIVKSPVFVQYIPEFPVVFPVEFTTALPCMLSDEPVIIVRPDCVVPDTVRLPLVVLVIVIALLPRAKAWYEPVPARLFVPISVMVVDTLKSMVFDEVEVICALFNVT